MANSVMRLSLVTVTLPTIRVQLSPTPTNLKALGPVFGPFFFFNASVLMKACIKHDANALAADRQIAQYLDIQHGRQRNVRSLTSGDDDPGGLTLARPKNLNLPHIELVEMRTESS
jgi:hypothetical protein